MARTRKMTLLHWFLASADIPYGLVVQTGERDGSPPVGWLSEGDQSVVPARGTSELPASEIVEETV
ncbi:MAG: hypothetical protein P4L46_26215 [Fimbriimonas sp.]|nr:hypothetical protein [Fimbriimonas sp.]